MKPLRTLREGKNCWRIAHSHRAAFLIDASAYFSAFFQAVERAHKSILITGWDVDSRVLLIRQEGQKHLPSDLGRFLNAAVSSKPNLQAYILAWDFSMIYTFEREPLPQYRFGWKTDPRLHFKLDDNHPLGASHHQKIVVVDDAVAFVGGIDLARFRWDTPKHSVDNPLRTDDRGRRYRPFHDVQMIVDGKAAAALGELVRERWRRATGEIVHGPETVENDPWPPGLVPDMENVPVAIARTEPAYGGYAEVREIEALYLDAISRARAWIYIENEYLTSTSIGQALAERLVDERGPEILIVLPRSSSGWLEENTMDALRSLTLKRLREADRFGRLRVVYPHVPGLGKDHLNVHAKVLVSDDHLVRIGSSNLSNRSMGLDTECDLAVEGDGDGRTEEAIARFRNRLLGEHLGCLPEKVEEAIRAKQSLIAAVDSLGHGERTLKPLEENTSEFFESVVKNPDLVDPERPSDPSELIARFVPQETGHAGSRRIAGSIVLLLVLVALAASWHWTPLGDWLDLETIVRWGDVVQTNPMAPLWVVAAYVVGGLIVFPVSLLIVATAIAFGPISGFVYSLLGCLVSALCGYGMGHWLGRETVRKLAGKRLNRLSQKLARRGLMTVITVRIIPIAPFTIVNLAAGASHIKLTDFALGTILGMIPGIVAVTVFGDSLWHVIQEPGIGSYMFLAAFALVILLANLWLRRWLTRLGGSASQ